MAPDRKPGEPGSPSNPGGGRVPHPTEPHRENIPGSLDHVSGSEEVFEARIISGADGVPAEPDGLEELDDVDPELDRQAGEALGDLDDDGDVDEEDARLARTRGREPARKRGGPRFINFLRASWAELQRVQWPNRRQVGQATGVVIGFVIIAGAYLGIADWAAQKVVDLIL